MLINNKKKIRNNDKINIKKKNKTKENIKENNKTQNCRLSELK